MMLPEAIKTDCFTFDTECELIGIVMEDIEFDLASKNMK